jgi:hypothetical protein
MLTRRQHQELTLAKQHISESTLVRRHVTNDLDGELRHLANIPLSAFIRAVYFGYIIQPDHPLKQEYDKNDNAQSDWARGYRAGIRNTLTLTNQTIEGIED